MKMLDGKIVLEAYHLERIFSSLLALQFNNAGYFITDGFKEQVMALVKKNRHKKAARIRVTIARGSGGLYDVENHHPNYVIQTWDLNGANNKFNQNGLVMDIYRDARKVCDLYSHIKSNNYLSYVMAALWAKAHKMNDVLLLNPYDRICDATIANVFIVKGGVIKTPALTEGCIDGVMRKYLLEKMREAGIPVEETQIGVEEVLGASEVFLTNSVFGIRWVKTLGKSSYTNEMSALLFKKFAAPLFFVPKRIKDPAKSFYLLKLKDPKEKVKK
jgi:branched-chain amino acid aminotransferase